MIGVVGSARDSLAAVNPDSASGAGAVAAERGFEGAVVEIEVGQKGLMDLRKFEEWVAILQRAETEKARAVVFRIDAPGGYVRETERLAEQVAELPVPCYALIEGKALGAGVLLALATQSIYVTPEALIGARDYWLVRRMRRRQENGSGRVSCLPGYASLRDRRAMTWR